MQPDQPVHTLSLIRDFCLSKCSMVPSDSEWTVKVLGILAWMFSCSKLMISLVNVSLNFDH